MSRKYDNELELERKLIESLGEGHNQWTYRSDLKSEADLWSNLREKITRNNLDALNDVMLTDYEFELIKTELLSKTTTPFNAAKWLKGENGIARITIDREDVSLGSLSLVLYSNRDIGGGISSYEVVNQIATKPSNADGRDRRFDITLLINGLPIVQIELKQVRAKDGFYQAFRQIKKYAEEGLFRNNIFSTLQLFVISNEQTTRYFANAMPEQMNEKFLFSWRTKDNERIEDIYEFSKQVLNIPDAHRLIADYTIVSEDQDNKTLMVLHPYQIHAIESLYRAAMQHQSGYIWHATGSGKTLTSFVSTKLLARKTGVDRTIMLVDRKDLDNQTTGEFTKFASEFNTGISTGTASSNSLIVGTGSSRELSEALLSESNTNTIIVTTRQKLDAAMRYAEKLEQERGTQRFKKLVGSHIVFVVDECHRAVSSEGMEEIKKFFPNSTWFGFTGTPIFEVNKKQAQGRLARTTEDQYGPCLHTYTIKNALDDHSVLGFQMEHADTVGSLELDNAIFRFMRHSDINNNLSDNELNEVINKMEPIDKEKYLSNSHYDNQKHIDTVIYKILKPDSASIKFKFKNGKP
ncbi:DEAD/DEAH box helicase family protein, partial [Erysipelothrix rhusiopathiae]|nr:DEAD/DEAH box helicase family protein [Erysipelothrix rhusiopathiae]